MFPLRFEFEVAGTKAGQLRLTNPSNLFICHEWAFVLNAFTVLLSSIDNRERVRLIGSGIGGRKIEAPLSESIDEILLPLPAPQRGSER